LAIGTERVIGGLKGIWRTDLPFVGYDGTVAVAQGSDVVLYDGETLKAKRRIADGAQDYWFPFMWDGFRPRAAALDQPVKFESVAVDTTHADSAHAADSTVVVADTTAPRGFIVSFAAFLTDDRAKELASRIPVGGDSAHFGTTTRE